MLCWYFTTDLVFVAFFFPALTKNKNKCHKLRKVSCLDDLFRLQSVGHHCCSTVEAICRTRLLAVSDGSPTLFCLLLHVCTLTTKGNTHFFLNSTQPFPDYWRSSFGEKNSTTEQYLGPKLRRNSPFAKQKQNETKRTKKKEKEQQG